MPLTLQQAFNLMQNDLEQFMLQVPVTVRRAGQGAITHASYYLDTTYGNQNTTGLYMGQSRTQPRFAFGPASSSTSVGPISCVHVPVADFDVLKPTDIVKVTSYEEANFLCTTMLSGCTFAIRKKKDGLEFIHIRPPSDMGKSASSDIQKAASKEFDVSFGRGDGTGTTYGPGCACSILGVKQQGRWNIFAQYQDSNHNVVRSECIYREPSDVGVSYV
ncbi:hypothetical protein N9R79_07315 [Vibrio sp.]|nr:hypothetical protein [Vibrio sp.]